MAKRKGKKYAVSILSILAVAALVIAFPGANGPAQEYPSGMVSYWKFDEGTGTTVYDSLRTNHGIIYGAAWTTGMVGAALSFDGVDDFVDTAYEVSFSTDTSFTIELWFKTDSLAEGERYLVDRDMSTNELISLVQTGDRIGFVIRDDAYTGHKWVFSYNVLSLGEWYHVAGVRDVSKDTLELYLNGISQGRTSDDTTTTISPKLVFGAHPWGKHWDGVIDEVAIYNRALSAEEIQQHYQNGLRGLGYLGAPFAAFTLTEAEIKFNEIPNNDKYEVDGEFTLNEASDSIDPVNEDVSVTMGSSTLTIPAGSFTEEKPGKFEFEGTIDGARVKMEIETVDVDVFVFKVKAKSVDLTSTANPVNIYLFIGNDNGSDEVRLEGKLKLKRRTK